VDLIAALRCADRGRQIDSSSRELVGYDGIDGTSGPSLGGAHSRGGRARRRNAQTLQSLKGPLAGRWGSI